jgi:hypothetical protein
MIISMVTNGKKREAAKVLNAIFYDYLLESENQ